jgi:hypothetical protein
MGDHGEVDPKSGLSRRDALRAGVAVGVGAAVWSGVSITSLGGTPAYAAGCTFPTIVDLTGQTGCRNTDQGCGADFGYHTLKSDLPEGFFITDNIAEGTCCDEVITAPKFNFPDGLTCVVYLEFSYASEGKCTNPFRIEAFPGPSPLGTPTSDSPIPVTLTCYPDVSPNTFYTIYAKCVGDGSDPTGC